MEFARVKILLLAEAGGGGVSSQNIFQYGAQNVGIGRPQPEFRSVDAGIAQETFDIIVATGEERQSVQGDGLRPFPGQLVADQVSTYP